MKNQYIIPGILLTLACTQVSHAQSLVVNRHSVSAFDSIPEEYRQAAANLRMMFMDRSVGANISSYLDCMNNIWANAPSYCKRVQHQDTIYNVDPSEVYWDGIWDRSNWQYRFWPDGCSEDVTCFIDYMEERLDSFDVMSCQFSYLAVNIGAHIADTLNGFFGSVGDDNKASTYAAFAAAHPDKKVIWWTTSLARGIGTPESASLNDQMRDYAAAHDIILFDVADILSHEPGDIPCFDNRDGITYKDEDQPDDGMAIPAICPHYTTETEGGHLGSVSAGGVRVAKAFWVLMARLSGWGGVSTSVEQEALTNFKLIPNPASEYVDLFLESHSTIQNVEISLLSLTGSVLSGFSYNNLSLIEHHIRIPLIEFPSGIYFIRLKSGIHLETKKLFVN